MSNGIALKQTEAIITLVSWNLKKQKSMKRVYIKSSRADTQRGELENADLAQGKVAKEGRGSVRLPKGEGRGGARNFQASSTVLGSNLSLKGPPVLWVRVESLQTENSSFLHVADLTHVPTKSMEMRETENMSPFNMNPFTTHHTAVNSQQKIVS